MTSKKSDLKVLIAGEKKFMGPGPSRLLSNIEKSGSVKKAAFDMNLSYSKAWKILNTIEDELDFKVIERKSGGNDGGESRLTEKGREFLEKYELFEKRCKKYAKEQFKVIFEDFSHI